MNDTAKVRWRCPNRDCSWSMVSSVAEDDEAAPRCICGGQMEQIEVIPVMTYLDFLRGETPAEEGTAVDGE